jgi:hypothetical protein
MENVEVIVEFNKSALRHGSSREDIRHAIINFLYDDVFEETPDKHLLLGFDSNGKLLEILYNVINEYSINVFHAMKCRSKFYHLINNQENQWHK